MSTTAAQYALLAGLLIASGLVLVMYLFVPSQPDLLDVLHRYSPAGARERARRTREEQVSADRLERVGMWAMRRIPERWWGTVPRRELALLQIPITRFYGRKIAYGVVGLLTPPLISYFAMVIGIRMPIVLPAAASLGLGALMFYSPNIDIRQDAVKARAEFRVALTAYIDLVALERVAGAGPEQALRSAATVGHSWVFVRLREEITRSAWRGIPPWDGLHELSEELGMPELQDVADIMRLSSEGSDAYESLRARTTSMRDALLNEEITQAAAVGERLSMPMTALGLVFLMMLLTPSLMQIIGL